jgi:hypothetical protein
LHVHAAAINIQHGNATIPAIENNLVKVNLKISLKTPLSNPQKAHPRPLKALENHPGGQW